MRKTFAKIFLIVIIFLMASSYCYAATPTEISINSMTSIDNTMLEDGKFYFTVDSDGDFDFALKLNGMSFAGFNGMIYRESDNVVVSQGGTKATVEAGQTYYIVLPDLAGNALDFGIGDNLDSSFVEDVYSGGDDVDDFEKLRTKNVFEQIISEFFLSMGDYAQDFLSKTLKDEVTVDKIVYNKVPMLNANFFENGVNASTSNASDIVRKVITDWFNWFRVLALIVILVSIVGAGIKILLGTGKGKSEAMEILKKVVMSVALIYLFPFVMRYAFDINEAIIQRIFDSTHTVTKTVGTNISPISDFQLDEIEERSPQYVSDTGLTVAAGSKEATQVYLNRAQEYARTADMMRIMRAFAGVTERFMYVILWYIMLAQTYILAIIYIKRYIVIAFLTAIYPLVIIGYITGNLFGESKNAFNTWCAKYFTNIFLQTIHAITYGVISGIIMVQLQEAISPANGGINNLNWLVMIIAVSFLFSGEKILARFWKASTTDSDRAGIKGAVGRIIGAPGRIFNMIRGH